MGQVIELCRRGVAVRHRKQPQDERLLVVGQPAPKGEQGKFVRVFNDLGVRWASWRGFPMAETIQRNFEVIRDRSHGVAAGQIMTGLDAAEGAAANTDPLGRLLLG